MSWNKKKTNIVLKKDLEYIDITIKSKKNRRKLRRWTKHDKKFTTNFMEYFTHGLKQIHTEDFFRDMIYKERTF